jgi:general secretion pathway protein L
MRLFIRIADVPGTDPTVLHALEWLLVDQQGALVSQGSGDPSMLDRLVDLKTVRDPDDVVLLVPTEHCLSIRCTVPGRTTGQIRRALPYVVEEYLADDIEAMHVAVGSVRRNAPVDVLLIERTMLQGWLASLASAGVVPGHALPEAALLPSTAGTVTLLFDGDRVMVRTPEQMVATELDTVKFVLESLATSSSEAGLRIVCVNGQIPAVTRAEVAQSTEHPIEWVDTESDVTPLGYLAAAFPGDAGTINLLQGALAPPRTGGTNWVRWRSVAALLGVWLLVLVASETVSGLWATHKANLLATQVEALYREYFPNDQRVQDPYKQMVAHLGGRTEVRTSFLSLLGNLAAGLAANPGAQLRSISYNDGRAELGAEVAVGGFDALEALKAAWGREGVAVDITSAEQQDQQVHARIRLRAG